jgi:cytochrome P450
MSTIAGQAAGAPVLDVDPFSPQSLADPYPVHDLMRDVGPVFKLERYGVWGVARQVEVRSVLTEWQSYCSSAGVGLTNTRKEKPWRSPGLVLEADPPLHTRTRAVLARILSPAAARTLRAAFEIEAVRLVDELVARGSFDAIKDLAEAYPLKVFPDAVGLLAAGRERLLPYGNMVFNAFGPPNELFKAAVAAAEHFQDWIVENCSRRALAPGSFGAQIYEAVDTGELSEDEAPRLVRAFLSAGLDTTVSALGNAIYLFGLFPKQWEILRSEPSLVRNAFEEAMRFESPFQMLFRTTARDVELGGQSIAADEKILVSLAAANRDPRHWQEPDRFDIRRREPGNMSMGTGIHGCVGQVVARLEGEILLAALASKVERIEIVWQPERRLNNTLRGLRSLPVRTLPR